MYVQHITTDHEPQPEIQGIVFLWVPPKNDLVIEALMKSFGMSLFRLPDTSMSRSPGITAGIGLTTAFFTVSKLLSAAVNNK